MAAVKNILITWIEYRRKIRQSSPLKFSYKFNSFQEYKIVAFLSWTPCILFLNYLYAIKQLHSDLS